MWFFDYCAESWESEEPFVSTNQLIINIPLHIYIWVLYFDSGFCAIFAIGTFLISPQKLRRRGTKPHLYTTILDRCVSRDTYEKSAMAVATVRENRHTSQLSVNGTLVVTNLYCHPEVSTHVGQTYNNTQLRFRPSGYAFRSRCHRPGFEPHHRRPGVAKNL